MAARPAPPTAGRARATPPHGAWTLAGTLARAAAYVPAALVPPAALARAAGVAAHLPAALTNWLYLECRLAPGPAPVDLAVLVDAGGRARLAAGLAAGGAPPNGDEPNDGARAWAGARALARRWADPGDPLHAALDGVWLEFDVPPPGGAPNGLPAPGVFADLGDALAARPRPSQALLAERALAALLGGEVPNETAAALRRCLGALPPGARAAYAGCMLSRGADAVRLCVMHLGAGELLSYLEAVGWPGELGEAGALVADLARADPEGAGAPAAVHLDVGAGGARPALGLEYPLTRLDQMRGRIREGALLDRLVALGAADPGKRRALDAWPGHEVGVMPHEIWPSVIVRRVNHVKLVCRPGRAPEAKAYLCLHHRPRTRGAPRTAASTE